MSGRIARALHAAFGLEPPADPPVPAAPDRFPVFGRPAVPAPGEPVPTPWHPERLALAGAVTITNPRR